jgi:hypothetical protein
MGIGCTLSNKRVTDHESCKEWEDYKPEKSIHDQDAVKQYFKAGYILDLGA